MYINFFFKKKHRIDLNIVFILTLFSVVALRAAGERLARQPPAATSRLTPSYEAKRAIAQLTEVSVDDGCLATRMWRCLTTRIVCCLV